MPHPNHNRQKMNRKIKDKKPTSAKSNEVQATPQANALRHICFCHKRTTDQTQKNIDRQEQI